MNEDLGRRKNLEAVALVKAINKMLDSCSHLHLMAGRCAFELRDYQKAIEHFTRAIVSRPDAAYLAEENGKATTVRFQHAEGLLPTKVGGLVDLSNIRFFDEQFMGQMYNRVRLKNDAAFFATCYQWLGKSYMMGPRLFHNAIQAYQAAIGCLEKLDPTERTPELSLGPSLFDSGMCHYFLRGYADAIPFYEQALRIYSGQERGQTRPDNYRIGIADCLLYLGDCYLRIGNQVAALENLRKSATLSQELNLQDNLQRATELISSASDNVARS